MSDLEGTIFNVFTHEVVMHVDVFRVCMETCFLRESDCTSIIDGEVGCWGGFSGVKANIVQEPAKP